MQEDMTVGVSLTCLPCERVHAAILNDFSPVEGTILTTFNSFAGQYRAACSIDYPHQRVESHQTPGWPRWRG